MAVGYNPRIVTDGLVLALDAGNTKSYQQNEISEPTDIYGWYTTIKGDSNANVCTITRDTTTASPVGNEPLKMVVTGTDPYLLSYNSSPWNLAPASQGETWVVSVYVKASTNTSIELFIFGGNSSGGAFSPTDYSASTINVTTEWKRYSHYHTFAQSATQYVQVRLDGPDTQVSGDASGQEIWWDGLQVERVPSGTTTPGRFNPNSKTFEDLSGRGNNGTLVNSPRRNFDNSGSLVFDGVDDEVICDIGSVLVKDFTLGFWMKSDASVEGRGVIEYGGTSYAIIAAYRLKTNSARFYFGTIGATNSLTLTSVNLADNNWHYVVQTYDGTNARVYVDGNLELDDSSTFSGNLRPSANNTLRMGRWVSSGTYQDMELASVKVYNKALTASEIKQNFNALRGRFGI